MCDVRVVYVKSQVFLVLLCTRYVSDMSNSIETAIAIAFFGTIAIGIAIAKAIFQLLLLLLILLREFSNYCYCYWYCYSQGRLSNRSLISGGQMQIKHSVYSLSHPTQHCECTLSFLPTQHYEEGESVN